MMKKFFGTLLILVLCGLFVCAGTAFASDTVAETDVYVGGYTESDGTTTKPLSTNTKYVVDANGTVSVGDDTATDYFMLTGDETTGYTLTVTGVVTITQEKSNGLSGAYAAAYGVYYDGTAPLTITGGSLNIGTESTQLSGSGIYSTTANLTISNATINVNCEQAGIRVQNTDAILTIASGTVTAKSQYAAGIYSHGTFFMNGGTLEASGNYYGIFAYDITLNGGVVKTSGNQGITLTSGGTFTLGNNVHLKASGANFAVSINQDAVDLSNLTTGTSYYWRTNDAGDFTAETINGTSGTYFEYVGAEHVTAASDSISCTDTSCPIKITYGSLAHVHDFDETTGKCSVCSAYKLLLGNISVAAWADGGTSNLGGTEAPYEMSPSSYSLRTVSQNGAAFETGAKITVCNVTLKNADGDHHTAVYTYDGSSWNSTGYILLSGENDEIQAWYGESAEDVSDVGTPYDTFVLPTYQNSGISAADWMTASNTATKGTPIALNFRHLGVKVTVNIAGYGSEYTGQETISSPRIYSPCPAMTATYGTDGSVSVSGGYGYRMEITPYTATANPTLASKPSYTAIVSPGGYTGDQNFVTLTVGNEDLTVLVGNNSTLGYPGTGLQSGYHYTFNLTVGHNTLAVKSVSDWPSGWNDETGLNGGTGTEDSGKDAWENGDVLNLTLPNSTYMEPDYTYTATLTYDGTNWTPSVVYDFITDENSSGSTVLYAPEGTSGKGEYLTGTVSVGEGIGKRVVSFGEAHRTYSRLRIMGEANKEYSVTVTGFTPAGAETAGEHTYNLTTDGSGNAYLYGTFAADGTVTVGSVSHTFSTRSEAEKSYALCVKHTSGSYSATGATITDSCTVCGKALGTATITAADAAYTGSAYAGASVNGTGTLESHSWTITYKQGENSQDTAPTNAGNYTASITVDNVTASADFTIEAKSIEGATVTVDSSADLTYTGSAITPTVTVELDGTMLNAGSYEVSYTDNVNAGPATVTVTGKGNYKDAVSISFTISKSTTSIAFNDYVPDKAYDGAPLANPTEEQLTITGATYEAVTFTWYEDAGDADAQLEGAPVNAGTYYVVASIAETTNTTAASETSETVTITKTEVTPVSGAIQVTNDLAANYTFDLANLLPVLDSGKTYGDVSYTLGEIALGSYYASGATINGSTLTLPIAAVQSSTEEQIGTITISITSTNYAFSQQATITVSSVNKLLPTGAPTLTPTSITYGQPLSAITLSGSMQDESGNTVSGTFTWDAPDTVYDAGTQQAAWTFTPNDTNTYLQATGTSSITVNKANGIMTTAPKPNTLTYDGTQQALVTAGVTTGGEMQYSLDGVNYSATIPTGIDAGQYTVWYKVVGDANHNDSAAQSILVTINKMATEFGSFEVLNGETPTTTFIYGDTITVKAAPQRATTFSLLRAFETPDNNQMALFIGDTQITAPVDAVGGVYTMTYETSGKALPVGKTTITAKYVGNDNLLGYEQSADITLNPKHLTIASVSAKDRIYNSDTFAVQITGATFTGKVLETDDVTLAENTLGTLAGDAVGTYTEVTLPDPTKLAGKHASYYTVTGGAKVSTNVQITEVPEDLLVKTEINENFSDADIPAELKVKFDTVAKIETELRTQITKQDSGVQGTELYDVVLMYSEDGGQTWIKADKEHFPKNGRLPVMLPIPEGTNPDSHDYIVTHMFTSSAFGKTPGDVEMPPVSIAYDAQGRTKIYVEVTGLSPIMVGWTEKEITVNLPQTGDDSNIHLWFALIVVSMASMVGVVLTGKKRREN